MTLQRTCFAALELVKRKNELWLGLFFLFFYWLRKDYMGKMGNGQEDRKKRAVENSTLR